MGDVQPSIPAPPARPLAVGVFEREAQARQAVQALGELGISEQHVGLVRPATAATAAPIATSDMAGRLAAAASIDDLQAALVSLGVGEGEARHYVQAVQSGQTLLIVDAGLPRAPAVREVLQRHGAWDVQSRGAELVRGDADRSSQLGGVPGGTRPRPVDVTGRWEDVISRYEMLWQQHYGTSDATWQQMAPIYRYAWEQANDPRLRGHPWSEAEASLRRDWQVHHPGLAWEHVAGPIRDVWEDVAREAATAEGGAERRIPRQGGDQAGPARDIPSP